MPHVAKLIAENPDRWIDILVDQYKINVVKDSPDNPRLVSLKYDMIESDMSHPIVQECRGMVVELATGQILVHGYNKFFNLGEGHAVDIDWETALVQEKLDGSLMQLYWNGTAWAVASSGNPVAGGTVWPGDQTFSQLFWQTFDGLGMKCPPDELRHTCFMFELCTNDNRIVVRHDKPRIACHGGRSLDTGKEWSWYQLNALATDLNWEMVKVWPINTVDAALAAASEMNPIETEGFVVVDGKFNRVKIKSPRYVAIHHLKGEFNPRRAIELWKAGEIGELLGYFPEMTSDVNPILNRLEYLAARAATDITSYGFASDGTPIDRKSFAMEVKHNIWAPVTFKMYGDRGASVDKAKSIMRDMPVSSIEKMMNQVSNDEVKSWYYPGCLPHQ